jgi:nitrogen fixation NifU-like protein
MMRDDPPLDDLYRELIVEHYRRPHNAAPLAHADVRAEGMNPLCGDEVRVELRFDGDRVAEAAFAGRGCAISQASASMMTDAVSGKPVPETVRLICAFERMLKQGEESDPLLGDLEALQGVHSFPVRVKCALLPWKVLREALDEYEDAGGSAAAVENEEPS